MPLQLVAALPAAPHRTLGVDVWRGQNPFWHLIAKAARDLLAGFAAVVVYSG